MPIHIEEDGTSPANYRQMSLNSSEGQVKTWFISMKQITAKQHFMECPARTAEGVTEGAALAGVLCVFCRHKITLHMQDWS